MTTPTTSTAQRATLCKHTAEYVERRLGDVAPYEGKAIRLNATQWRAIVDALKEVAGR